MAEEPVAQTTAINTSQPTPLRGLKVRGHKTVETVCIERDGETLVINKADYNEEEHGKTVNAPLPTRKKKASKKKAATEDEE